MRSRMLTTKPTPSPVPAPTTSAEPGLRCGQGAVAVGQPRYLLGLGGIEEEDAVGHGGEVVDERVGMAKADSIALASMAQGALVRTIRPSTTGPAPEMQQSSGLKPGSAPPRLFEEAAEGGHERGLFLGAVVAVEEEGEGAALLA